MEIIVFASPGCKLLQNGNNIEENYDQIDNDFRFVAHKFIVDNNSEIEIKETLNSFILRLLNNLISVFGFIGGGKSSNFIDTQRKVYEKNNATASFVFMPLFKFKGKLKIKPIDCDENTLIYIYLLKTKIPFMVDCYDGKIENLENKR